STILNGFSQGYNFVNHLGHSATTYTMRLSNNQVTASNITNNGSNHNFSTLYTQGCYGGAFDNRETNPGQYTSDCISEKFQALQNGVVAMLSNSRYGWGSNGNTNGPSQYYHRQFIDALFGENINQVGWANADSKADVIPFLSSGTMYWCYYQVNLFGDPGMRNWTATPQDVQVVQNGAIAGGSFIANFTVSTPNADVRIMNGTDLIYVGTSDGIGNVYALFDQALYPGAFQLIVNADNHYPLYHNFNVIPSNEPYITCTTASFHDADGIFQLGDHVMVDVTVENIGTTDTNSGGSVSLSTESNLINILNPVVNITSLPDTQQLVIQDAFELVLQGSFSDQTTVPIQFSTSFDGNITNYSATITLNAAHINLTDMQVNSENYYVSPGDDVEVYFTFENSGSAPAEGVMVFFINSSPYITLNSTDIMLDTIPIDGTTTNVVPLTVHISETCPMDTQIDLNYLAGGNGTNSVEDVISLLVSSGMFTFEPSSHNFTDYIVTPEFQDQWHRETQRNHTPGGGFSMKFGGSGTNDYANGSHGALETVPMTVLAGSQFKFWHWMAAEDDSNGMAWDGGMLEMSVDNGPWIQINPIGGYPYMITDNVASPFDAYTEVYSGSFGWLEAIFDLGSTDGSCRFRFVFGSDGYVSAEGWYIDDVSIFNQAVSNDEDVQFVTQINKLNSNYPNPFNPETTISFNLKATVNDAKVEIFNVRGQKEVVLNLDRATREAGTVTWKADELSSGVYFYRLIADGKTVDTKKAILMK
ncbi:MAG: C25 family cysteine peptidase, partial [Candidatus Zophobacter franzmannii]|nr:C25 family cysteine peptidase [Candidatus Zophobacter franzmannii]